MGVKFNPVRDHMDMYICMYVHNYVSMYTRWDK